MPAERDKVPADAAVMLLPGEGRAILAGSDTLTYKLASHDSGGAFSVIERVVGPHFQSPPQPHANMREHWAVYVLEGLLVFKFDDREVEAPAGSFIFIPKGLFFRWWNPLEQPGKCLVIYSPAGFEEYFAEIAETMKSAPPSPINYTKVLPTLRRIQDKYGMVRQGD